MFVHGIGTQPAGETFLDWSRPLIELLAAWSRPAPGSAAREIDPVIRSRFSFTPTQPPLLELRIPPGSGREEERWLITEAWWATDIRPPGFTEAVSFLRHRLGRIVHGVRAGYDELGRRSKSRRDESTGDHVAAGDPARWRWVDRLDLLQARTFGRVAVLVPLALLGVAALAGYSLLRKVPFGPVRRFAELAVLDTFLVQWFGDLNVLLGDPAQAANVRTRVADAIDRLQAEGADDIVIVAHSGGAIVSFQVLTDPEFDSRPVAKLITLGEGLKLAWSLADETGDESLPGRARLTGDLRVRRKGLRWVDIWASYDPAPAGTLAAPPGHPVAAWLRAAGPERAAEAREAHPDAFVCEDRPITNRMNVLRDHGAYWANPEGFLIPLVRHLDDPHGDGSASRFYPSRTGRWARIERRRQRVGMLAAWDWLCSLGAISAIGLAWLSDLAVGALDLSGRIAALAGRLEAIGHGTAAFVSGLPGAELITGPVTAYGRLVGDGLRAIATGIAGTGLEAPVATALDAVGGWGPGFLGALVVAAAFLGLASIGNGRWDRWDRVEGRRLLADPAPPVDRRAPFAEGAVFVGLAAGLWLLVLTTSLLVALLAVAAGIAGAVLVRSGSVR